MLRHAAKFHAEKRDSSLEANSNCREPLQQFNASLTHARRQNAYWRRSSFIGASESIFRIACQSTDLRHLNGLFSSTIHSAFKDSSKQLMLQQHQYDRNTLQRRGLGVGLATGGRMIDRGSMCALHLRKLGCFSMF